MKPSTLHFLLLTVARWMNRRHAEAIEYLLEETAFREHLGKRRLRFTDAQRRWVAEKGKRLGLERLQQLASIVTLETFLLWYRRLVADKYDGSKRRGPGRPAVAQEIRDLGAPRRTEESALGRHLHRPCPHEPRSLGQPLERQAHPR